MRTRATRLLPGRCTSASNAATLWVRRSTAPGPTRRRRGQRLQATDVTANGAQGSTQAASIAQEIWQIQIGCLVSCTRTQLIQSATQFSSAKQDSAAAAPGRSGPDSAGGQGELAGEAGERAAEGAA